MCVSIVNFANSHVTLKFIPFLNLIFKLVLNYLKNNFKFLRAKFNYFFV